MSDVTRGDLDQAQVAQSLAKTDNSSEKGFFSQSFDEPETLDSAVCEYRILTVSIKPDPQ